MPDFSLLALALFIGLLTLFLYDFKKLMKRNVRKLDPKYMNDANSTYETSLHLDKEGNTIIKSHRRYYFSRYL